MIAPPTTSVADFVTVGTEYREARRAACCEWVGLEDHSGRGAKMSEACTDCASRPALAASVTGVPFVYTQLRWTMEHTSCYPLGRRGGLAQSLARHRPSLPMVRSGPYFADYRCTPFAPACCGLLGCAARGHADSEKGCSLYPLARSRLPNVIERTGWWP